MLCQRAEAEIIIRKFFKSAEEIRQFSEVTGKLV
jgi:hypothetical protein